MYFSDVRVLSRGVEKQGEEQKFNVFSRKTTESSQRGNRRMGGGGGGKYDGTLTVSTGFPNHPLRQLARILLI